MSKYKKNKKSKKVVYLPKPSDDIHLSKFGYEVKKASSTRKKSLRKASKKYGTLPVLRRVNLIRTLQKSNKDIHENMTEDVEYLKKKYRSEKTKKSISFKEEKFKKMRELKKILDKRKEQNKKSKKSRKPKISKRKKLDNYEELQKMVNRMIKKKDEKNNKLKEIKNSSGKVKTSKQKETEELKQIQNLINTYKTIVRGKSSKKPKRSKSKKSKLKTKSKKTKSKKTKSKTSKKSKN